MPRRSAFPPRYICRRPCLRRSRSIFNSGFIFAHRSSPKFWCIIIVPWNIISEKTVNLLEFGDRKHTPMRDVYFAIVWSLREWVMGDARRSVKSWRNFGNAFIRARDDQFEKRRPTVLAHQMIVIYWKFSITFSRCRFQIFWFCYNSNLIWHQPEVILSNICLHSFLFIIISKFISAQVECGKKSKKHFWNLQEV